jgi:hypothetical protein
VLAGMVNEGLTAHNVDGTAASYASAVRNYETFCAAYGGLRPFPVDSIQMCAWMRVLASSIATQSMGEYMAAVRDAQGTLGLLWSLDGDEYVRRMRRFLKRKFGTATKSLKTPISLRVLHRILPLLPGWPRLSAMSHDDRAFAAASLVGVTGCLRGGEFLHYAGSGRPVLLTSQVTPTLIEGQLLVVIYVARPKAKWWILEQPVYCFAAPQAGPMDPATVLGAYRDLSPVRLADSDPAFRLSSGATLTKEYMVQRTESLLRQAGVLCRTKDGTPTKVNAKSWRAGAVSSAREAGLSDALVREWGRWKSSAWLNYYMQSPSEMRAASATLWAVRPSSEPTSSSWLVGESLHPMDADLGPAGIDAQVRGAMANRRAHRSSMADSELAAVPSSRRRAMG